MNKYVDSIGKADAESLQNRKRFLIVSLGSIGARHLRNLRALQPDAEIAVLRRPSSTSQVVEGADRVIHHLDQALAFAPMAAIIASPASHHMSFALRLAEAGVHLFIEKPIAIECASVRTLIDLCRARSLVVAVGYDLRFDSGLIKLRELVQAGTIGDVYSIRIEVGQYLPDWRPGTDYQQGVSAKAELGGGVLLELSHEFDYLQWIFGMPARVTALGGRSGQLDIDVEDLVEVAIEYGSRGPWASVHLDMLQRQPYRRCRAVGTNGSVVWDGIAGYVELSLVGGSAPVRFENLAPVNGNQAYLLEMENFVSSIQRQSVPACTGEDALKALTIALAARRSLVEGCAVPLSGEDKECVA